MAKVDDAIKQGRINYVRNICKFCWVTRTFKFYISGNFIGTILNIKILITVQVWKAESALRFHRLFPGSE